MFKSLSTNYKKSTSSKYCVSERVKRNVCINTLRSFWRRDFLLTDLRWHWHWQPNQINYDGKWEKYAIISKTIKLKSSVKEPNKFHIYETISGERTEQLDIFCHVTGFRSDFRLPQTSADICVGHDNLRWKNRTKCNRFWSAGCSQLEYIDIRLVY